MTTILVHLPEHVLVQLDKHVTKQNLPTRDVVIWDALQLFLNDDVICKTCDNGREFSISELPLSGFLRVCPECGESNFELWRGKEE